MRLTAGANAWRKVERVMESRRYCKGNVLSSYVTTAYMNVLDTISLTEKQQDNVQVCENLVRIIVGVKRPGMKRIDVVRLGFGAKECLKEKLAMSK